MRFYGTLNLILALIVFAPAGCGGRGGGDDSNRAGGRVESTPQVVSPPADGVRRIGLEELQAALERGEAVALDVRGSVEYDLGHIRGSLSLPLGLIRERAKELPRDKLIVTYCAWTHEQLSARAVQEMKKAGIENAAALLGGWDAWVKAGLPTDKSEWRGMNQWKP
jgi:rhodanese-related sulfurtransferase